LCGHLSCSVADEKAKKKYLRASAEGGLMC
jgi:hypothetical protein